jgi:5-methylcytosine-specific restriction endonuclease McrA
MRRIYVEQARLKALALFNSVCKICGFANTDALQIDHINGGGTKERKTGLMGYRLYIALLKGERKLNDLQLLCANCHVIKQRRNKEWSRVSKIQ